MKIVKQWISFVFALKARKRRNLRNLKENHWQIVIELLERFKCVYKYGHGSNDGELNLKVEEVHEKLNAITKYLKRVQQRCKQNF
ncbi:CLUMA_CG014989, isoform A [Clunio marinus]|uniref:CLUMA_CG014989, isoform A n=1 Tax=Clunio marinus TaxID=568069 RepID=A0A1J1ING6_9DIPT|nr:CLUMA_CG014989, isoform A [Clunio marinus]